MTEQTHFDRVLPGLFDELAAARTPDYLEAAIERASSRNQRAAWTYPGRWLPMLITTHAAPVARMPWRAAGRTGVGQPLMPPSIANVDAVIIALASEAR